MPSSAPSTPRPPRAATEAGRPPAQVPGEPHRWTVEEYHRLGEAGWFDTGVELIHGVIVDKHTDGDTLEERRHRWTLAEYDRFAEGGGFGDLRVELIHGEVVDKVRPQGSRHSTVIDYVESALEDAFGEGVVVRTQRPFVAYDASEPEPDLMVVPGSPRDYLRAHPATAVLIVEVAESSLKHDRKKAALYAASGVPEYWIVNLSEGVLEVYREPSGDAYRTKITFEPGDTVAPVARPDAAIPVADLLP